MITVSGRKYIINNGFNAESIKSVAFSKDSFASVNIGALNDQDEKVEIMPDSGISITKNDNATNNSVTFTIRFENITLKNAVQCNSIKLLTADNKVFSYLTIPTYTISPSNSFSGEYILYF